VAAVALLSSCAGLGPREALTSTPTRSSRPSSAAPSATASTSAGPVNVYADATAGKLSATAQLAKSLAYVPNSITNTVQVIDPGTFQVIATYQPAMSPSMWCRAGT